MTDVVIHIGYHRTGSTFLQDRVFPALPVNRVIKPTLRSLFGDAYDPRAFDDEIRRGFAIDPSRTTVISSELLSGTPEGGPLERRQRTAERLHQAYPEARILIVVRNQIEYVLSIYAYRVLLRGLESRSLARYLDHHDASLADALQYDRLVGCYVDLFGAAAVQVIPLEKLADDARGFVDDVATLVGVVAPADLSSRPVNESTRSRAIVEINRWINAPLDRTLGALRRRDAISHTAYLRLARPYFVVKERALNPTLRRWLAAPRGGDRLAPPEAWLDRMTPVFAVSNRRLAALTGVDFARYGYAT